jgi:hypothetical protein
MKIELLSDDEILKITNYKCISNEYDFNIRYSDNRPVSGGLFDYDIFGDYNNINEDTRFNLAYYLLCYPIVYPTKLLPLIKFINDNLSSLIYIPKKTTIALKILIFSYFEIIQCSYDDSDVMLEKNNLYYKVKLTEIENDEVYIENFEYKYMGLFGILNLHTYNLVTPDKSLTNLKELSNYININLLISNPKDRPTTFFTQNKKVNTSLHSMTQNYKIVINLSKKIENKLYNDNIPIFEKCMLALVLNDIVSEMITSHRFISRDSKTSTTRSLLSTRIGKSGRTTIVGDPEIPLNYVSIPRPLLYSTLKNDIIKMIEDKYTLSLGRIEYANVTSIALKCFEAILKDLVVIINRNPSLHKYNMLAFKVISNDDYVMKLPLLVTKIFGADFDGDTMSYYVIVDNEMQKLAMKTMSAESNWLYEKYNSYLFTPRHEILYGLTLLTKIINDKNILTLYDKIEDVKKDINKGIIKENSKILYQNKETCYGRLLINNILQFDIFNDILNNDFISLNNIYLFMTIIDTFEDKVYILTELQKISLNASTILSNSAMNLNELFDLQDSLDYNSPIDMSIQIKNNLKINFREVIESNDRLKFNSLIDMIVKTDEKDNSTLLEGMNESNYINHSLNNRILLNVKQKLVPTSGSITRQVASLGMNLIYCDNLNNTPESIRVKREWLKNNRVIINKHDNGDVDIISSVFNDSNKIYKNEIDNGRFNYTNNHPIGLSLLTSLTEELTQSALSLKHGGRLYSEENIELTTPVDGIITNVDKNIMTINDSINFIIPSDFKFKPINTHIKKDEIIINGYLKRFVDYKLEGFKLLVELNAKDLLNKTLKNICYAPYDGILTYDVKPQRFNKKKVDGVIKINDNIIDSFNKNLIYYRCSNQSVKKYDRLSDGIVDLYLFNQLTSLKDTFYIFCKQYYELFGNKINLELLEILFKLIYKNEFSVRKSLKNKDDLLGSLAYGNLKNNINKFLNNSDYNEDMSLIRKVLL